MLQPAHEMQQDQDEWNAQDPEHHESFRVHEMATAMGKQLVIPNKQKQAAAQKEAGE